MPMNHYQQLSDAVGALELETEELQQQALPLYDRVIDNHLANIRDLVVSLRATCNNRASLMRSAGGIS